MFCRVHFFRGIRATLKQCPDLLLPGAEERMGGLVDARSSAEYFALVDLLERKYYHSAYGVLTATDESALQRMKHQPSKDGPGISAILLLQQA